MELRGGFAQQTDVLWCQLQRGGGKKQGRYKDVGGRCQKSNRYAELKGKAIDCISRKTDVHLRQPLHKINNFILNCVLSLLFLRITKLTLTCYTDLIFSLNRLWVAVTILTYWSKDIGWKLNYTGCQPSECTAQLRQTINYVKDPSSEKTSMLFAFTSDNLCYDISEMYIIIMASRSLHTSK